MEEKEEIFRGYYERSKTRKEESEADRKSPIRPLAALSQI